jgi:hypothetical protein
VLPIRVGRFRQIRSELAAIYRLRESAKMVAGEANWFRYLLTQLASMTVESQLEAGVEKLEKRRELDAR